MLGHRWAFSEDPPLRSVLEAIGSIVLNQSDTESTLFVLLLHFLGLDDEVVGRLFSDLSDRARVDTFRRLAVKA